MAEKKKGHAALQTFPYGLFIVGSINGTKVSTIVANWATQVSFQPPLVGIAIENGSKMKLYIEQSNVFSINVLATGSKETAKAFVKTSEPVGNKINNREFSLASRGTPFLKDAIASIECRVVHAYPAGDHMFFVGEVLESVMNREGDALTLKETGWVYKR